MNEIPEGKINPEEMNEALKLKLYFNRAIIIKIAYPADDNAYPISTRFFLEAIFFCSLFFMIIDVVLLLSVLSAAACKEGRLL